MNMIFAQSPGSLVVGVNDNQLCRGGWHDRSMDGRSGILYRPTTKEAEFDLFLEQGDLELIALVSAGTTLCGGMLRGGLFSNGKLVGDFQLDSENWVLRRFKIPGATKGWIRFTWRIHNPYVPHDTLKNGDFREMGIYFAAIRMERKKS